MEFGVFATLLLAASAFASPLSGNQRSRCEDDSAALYVNITASPFRKIMNVHITTPDAVLSTPAIVLVGTDTKLLRCLYEDPNECEVLFDTGTKVYSLLISGEYIFMGLNTGKILRCNLNQRDSCEDFQTDYESVLSLSSADRYLYAGLRDGNIARCLLNEPKSCHTIYNLYGDVYSLIHSNDYLYAGMSDGRLMRCSGTTISGCSLHTDGLIMNDRIMGLANEGNSILAVTWDGLMWNCTQKPGDVANYCEPQREPLKLSTKPYGITSFNGILYTNQEDKGIYKCSWPRNMDCAYYGNFKSVYSMAFAYGTYQMQNRYRNEDTSCDWQSGSACPPYVTYYTIQQRAMLEVHVDGGRLYNSLRVLVDTTYADEGKLGPAAIFGMGPDGKILLSNRHVTKLLHTSSLFAGNPASGVGEMIVKNGVIQKIRACSDHYQPDLNLNRQVIQSLRAQGYTEHIDSVLCSEDDDPTDSNKVQ